MQYQLSKERFYVFTYSEFGEYRRSMEEDSKLNNFLNIGGMEHGHMLGTYYFLSNDYNDELELRSANEIVTELHLLNERIN